MFTKHASLPKDFFTCLQHHENTDYFNIDEEYLQLRKNGMMCYLCLDIYSKYLESREGKEYSSEDMLSNGNIIPVKIILKQIQSTLEEQDQCFYSSAEIQMKIGKISDYLQSKKLEFQNGEQVIKAWNNEASNIRKRAMKAFQLKPLFFTITTTAKNPKHFQQEFTNYYLNTKQCWTTNIQDLQDKQSIDRGAQLFRFVNSYVKEIDEGLQKLEKSNSLRDYNVLIMFNISPVASEHLKFSFATDMMGTCMKLISDKQIEMVSATSQRIAIMNPCLQKTNRTKRWRIQIVKLSSWIGVGACHIQKIKDANFHFNYSQTNHGSYFISSNGYSWSGYQPSFNSKFQSFSFTTGDIIKLEFNPKEMTLKFQKEGQDKKYSLQIQKCSDKLFPAVNLTGVGDNVKILPN